MNEIYVINLEERTDRWDQMKQLYSEFDLIRVDAVKHEKGAVGCFLSHKKCIQIAKEKELSSIIVIEDDCRPLDDFVNRLRNIKNFLDTYSEWDMLIGGGFHICPFNIKEKITDDLYRTNGGYCMHFVIYHHSSYDFFLNQNETDNPIDHVWQDQLRCLVPIPFLASQLDSYSNIGNWMENVFSKRIRRNNRILINHIQSN